MILPTFIKVRCEQAHMYCALCTHARQDRTFGTILYCFSGIFGVLLKMFCLFEKIVLKCRLRRSVWWVVLPEARADARAGGTLCAGVNRGRGGPMLTTVKIGRVKKVWVIVCFSEMKFFILWKSFRIWHSTTYQHRVWIRCR